MKKQTEFTFTLGSDWLAPQEWKRLQRVLAELISRDFGGCRFVWGDGAWRDGADVASVNYKGLVHEDETLSLIVAVPFAKTEAAGASIQKSVADAIRLAGLTDRFDWIDTTSRTVTARHWQVSKFTPKDA